MLHYSSSIFVVTFFCRLRSFLAQLSYSTAELNQLLNKSELTIREHCDSIRQQVDIAREIALENIHKASNALMAAIDTYETRMLVELDSGQGVQRGHLGRCEKTDESVPRRAAHIYAKCPGKWHWRVDTALG